ncbi:MAG: hypothetical protein A2V88_10330 [Elusimicrobia bacterium RBG_16_66_12]|nr:MAG: hypothetical protein A2V88_10330 [Elusimicrobia bacterium RBG_16_66_12]
MIPITRRTPTFNDGAVDWNTGDVVVIKGGVRLTLEWMGEGWSGDYNPNDKEDEPLMRFFVERKVGHSWEPVEDASFCTRIPASIPMSRKIVLAKMILNAMCDAVQSPGMRSPKKIGESLSWIDSNGICDKTTS